MQAISESAGLLRCVRRAHEHLRAESCSRVRSAEQKQRWLPPLIARREGVLRGQEPDAGLNTAHKTFARRENDRYVCAAEDLDLDRQVASQMLTWRGPLQRIRRQADDGLSLFYTDLDRRYVEVRKSRDGPQGGGLDLLFIEELPVPAADRIGADAKGSTIYSMGSIPSGPDRGGSPRTRPRWRSTVRRLRQRARRVRPADRQNQAHPASAGRSGWSWSREPAGVQGASLVRKRDLRRRGECRESTSPPSLLPRVRDGDAPHGGMGYAKEYHTERFCAGDDPAFAR